MSKNLLVIYYSQSGQLRDIVHNIAAPIAEMEDVTVTYYNIELVEAFSFPWRDDQFMDTFPESYLQVPNAIKAPPESVWDKQYDLIIFGYQVWFLTPSIPIISFLKSEYAARLLSHTPIITVSATRNMWMLSQEKLKKMLLPFQSPLVGNIALVDRNNNYMSVITILKWMKTGQKKLPKPWPEAGVASAEIAAAGKYGKIIQTHFAQKDYDLLQESLVEAGAIEIRPFLVRVEQSGNSIFKVWSRIIINKQKSRPIFVKLFTYYLFLAIWLVSPIVLVLHLLLTPLRNQKRKERKNYLLGTAYEPRQFDI